MRITGISAYRVEIPLHEGRYKWSGGNSIDVFDSIVVATSTDEGLTGYGELCPLGPAYLAAYAAGRLAASKASALGIQPRMDILGSPVLRIGQA